MSDIRRREMVERFFRYPYRLGRSVRWTQRLDWLPQPLWRWVGQAFVERQKAHHFGQVIPIEDVERILDLANSIVRLACICRLNTVGPEQRYCYGISLGTDGGELSKLLRSLDVSYLTGPDTAGLELMPKEMVLANFREYERRGLIHTVWTFETPFIGGLCNCNSRDCMAMRAASHGVTPFFRAEYDLVVEEDKCQGCGACLKVCSFDALRMDGRCVRVNPMKCYGCGVCRSVCPTGALVLRDCTIEENYN